ncbi:MAG: ABC transporter permease [Anaerolineae bacterium]|nr:ABC transporter permease [Anaerolineae bacterium]MDQ7034757.1 ABC transporter permease [Anaerolineae bacterium]
MTNVIEEPPKISRLTPQTVGIAVLMLVVIAMVFWMATIFAQLTAEDELLLDSTVGELGLWMSDQTEEDEIESILGQFAENWAQSLDAEFLEPEIILDTMQNGLVLWTGTIGILAIIGIVTLFMQSSVTRHSLLAVLLGLDVLLFIVPVIDNSNVVTVLLLAITLMLVVLLFAPGKVTRVLGFFVVLSTLFIVWETSKAFAASVNYKILLSQESWEYSTYPILDDGLLALENGDVDAIILDRRDLSDVMVAQVDPDVDPETMPYPNLRYLDNLDRTDRIGLMSVAPEFPSRLSIAVRVEDGERWSTIPEFLTVRLATVEGEFADTNYLSQPRNLVVVDLKILNNINLPHLQTIAEAFLQPARRNGSQLLLRILADAGFYTWGEAALGFVFGALFGFMLGVVFAHSAIMERSLLPYVVASQTVPILAIAPMVVIWLGASQTSVSVIAAYLTFFPVTINTLRGLQSPSQIEVDLMRSYAANHWAILWKLRVPAALPYIFTALKVSATASVVGAIIGELPSGIGDGLGRAILDFSSDYSLISTPKLWASIIMAASVGVFFFVAVSIAERFILGRYIRNL